MEKSLLRDDRPDQKGNQNDDRHGPQADAVELIHHGGETERARPDKDARQRVPERAKHHDEGHDILPGADNCAAGRFERREAFLFPRGRWLCADAIDLS